MLILVLILVLLHQVPRHTGGPPPFQDLTRRLIHLSWSPAQLYKSPKRRHFGFNLVPCALSTNFLVSLILFAPPHVHANRSRRRVIVLLLPSSGHLIVDTRDSWYPAQSCSFCSLICNATQNQSSLLAPESSIAAVEHSIKRKIVADEPLGYMHL